MSNADTKLKPCPFCGGHAEDIQYGDGNVHAKCEDDCCVGGCIITSQKFWNTRPVEDALRERVKELEEDSESSQIEYIRHVTEMGKKIGEKQSEAEYLSSILIDIDDRCCSPGFVNIDAFADNIRSVIKSFYDDWPAINHKRSSDNDALRERVKELEEVFAAIADLKTEMKDGSEYARGFNDAKWIAEKHARAALTEEVKK